MTAASGLRLFRLVSAAVLVVAGLFHFEQAATGHGDVLRHLVFVLINLGLAAGLVLRPRLVFWPVVLVTIQQLASHGMDFERTFNNGAPFDKVSLAVCLFFPTLLTALYLERQES